MNNAYTVHNSKFCHPKSTNAEKKKRKKKKKSGKRETCKTQTPDSVKSKRPLYKFYSFCLPPFIFCFEMHGSDVGC